MEIILVHCGKEVPYYLDICVNRIRGFTGTTPTLICSKECRVPSDPDRIDIESLEDDDRLQEFSKLSWYKAWGRPNTTFPSPDGFVEMTSKRIHLLDAYVRINNKTNVWHMEYDNILFADINTYAKALLLSQEKLMCCDMGPQYVVFNMVYVPNKLSLTTLCDFLLLNMRLGEPAIKAKYGMEMVQEMSLIKSYQNETKNIDFLPSLPHDNHDLIFDPASYGQFFFGTNNGHGPGFIDTANHDIGKLIQVGAISPVVKNGLPYVEHRKTGKLFKLLNLHMHNKNAIKEFANV